MELIDAIIVCRHGLMTKDDHNLKVGIQVWHGILGVEPIDAIIVCRHSLLTKDNHNSKVGIQVWHGIFGVVQWSDDTYS